MTGATKPGIRHLNPLDVNSSCLSSGSSRWDKINSWKTMEMISPLAALTVKQDVDHNGLNSSITEETKTITVGLSDNHITKFNPDRKGN